jgi:hypothetical protein
MECRKYVSDSCLRFIEVVRVVIGLEPVALHPIGLDLIYGHWPDNGQPYPRKSERWAEAGGQGAVAQLGERLICIQEVAGSIPTSSTSSGKACSLEAKAGCLSPRRKGASKCLWSGPVAQVARAHP